MKKKLKLLVVDDEPSIGLFLEHYFSKDYDVVVKLNGFEAIAWLQQGNITDGIVADYEMPLMNGLDFVKQLRASNLYKDIPLVMLSGIDQTSNKIMCLKSGADDYMVKPFNPEELDIRIKNMLKRVNI
ncbi:response regulator transcription factor [Pontibacter sp. SGAir0037]|uniref:response regulator transcription factor n=1 Tax=Pontibacter sp. SGAir0037 TaxID=2571030 RepID=UPI0010CD19BD|nr:response regulator transcription factor [Pontibacter sp. SGAir0037]QCR22506.1 two-component system response regulator [Pontibacter sp. SGAir0037]